jgi:hypothetical protein
MTVVDVWRKSSYSGQESDCVEVRGGVTVGVRDTKDRQGGQLAVSVAGWAALVDVVKTSQ